MRRTSHINGKVIMYADRVTHSMRQALEEMSRRRIIQEEYNNKHHITPTSIVKAIRDIMAGAHIEHEEGQEAPKEVTQYLAEKPDKLSRKIKDLEKKMYQYARDLEFEKAAKVRDEIHYIYKVISNS